MHFRTGMNNTIVSALTLIIIYYFRARISFFLRGSFGPAIKKNRGGGMAGQKHKCLFIGVSKAPKNLMDIIHWANSNHNIKVTTKY